MFSDNTNWLCLVLVVVALGLAIAALVIALRKNEGFEESAAQKCGDNAFSSDDCDGCPYPCNWNEDLEECDCNP